MVTGVTGEVLFLRPLKRFTLKDSLEFQDRPCEPFGPTLATSAYGCVQHLQQNKTKESNAAQDCAAGWRY